MKQTIVITGHRWQFDSFVRRLPVQDQEKYAYVGDARELEEVKERNILLMGSYWKSDAFDPQLLQYLSDSKGCNIRRENDPCI